ncbi:Tn3 family transposase [Streptomyces sp. NPDC058307]|uniref:Tn3 family transposase n=1 Tax=Streptomyces sp. NPDC058307 TaxID=3346439 RepID=UPI0036EB59AD
MLRVAGSLINNQGPAYDLLRMFGREGHPAPLGPLSPSTAGGTRPCTCPPWSTRSLMNRQLTVHECRHRLAPAICHGVRGQIRQAYREDQGEPVRRPRPGPQCGGPMGTRCLDAAVALLRTDGHDIEDEDAARLSPLKDRHINFLGRYLFNIKAGCLGQDCARCGTRTQSSTTKTGRPPTAAGCQAAGTSAASYCSTPQGNTTQDTRKPSRCSGTSPSHAP